jgi:hypothetical protein
VYVVAGGDPVEAAFTSAMVEPDASINGTQVV